MALLYYVVCFIFVTLNPSFNSRHTKKQGQMPSLKNKNKIKFSHAENPDCLRNVKLVVNSVTCSL